MIRVSRFRFKLFTSETAEKIFEKLSIERFGFDIELLVIAQMMDYKIPVEWINPRGENVGIRTYLETLWELCKITIRKWRGIWRERMDGIEAEVGWLRPLHNLNYHKIIKNK